MNAIYTIYFTKKIGTAEFTRSRKANSGYEIAKINNEIEQDGGQVVAIWDAESEKWMSL